MTQINACRFCKDDSTQAKLHKYGVRHYACAACGFARWGLSFVDRLPVHEVRSLPYRRVLDAGLSFELLDAYVKTREIAQNIGRTYTIAQAIDDAGDRIVAKVRKASR